MPPVKATLSITPSVLSVSNTTPTDPRVCPGNPTILTVGSFGARSSSGKLTKSNLAVQDGLVYAQTTKEVVAVLIVTEPARDYMEQLWLSTRVFHVMLVQQVVLSNEATQISLHD